jgi:hypothetical protein
VQGVSTRKVKAITEELCGHSFSASAISAIDVRLDDELAPFAGRRLDEGCSYLILDARYERVREAGVIRSQAVLLAIGIGWDGRRSILAVELATARAARAGATSCSGCASAACRVSSSWYRTIMPGSGRRSSRSCRKPSGSAATWGC